MGTVLSVSPRKTITPLPSTCFSSKMAKETQIRQNYHEECEALVNKQANMKLYHGYVYMSMYTYFTRDDLALPGFANFFKKASEKEWFHGAALMKYQTMRGGRVVLQDITKPDTLEWGTPLEAMTKMLDMEKKETQELQTLYTTAMTKGDFHLVYFIQNFMKKQITNIKLIADLVTKVRTVGDGPGLYMVDKDIMEICTTKVHAVNNELIKKLKSVEIADPDTMTVLKTEDDRETFVFDKELV